MSWTFVRFAEGWEPLRLRGMVGGLWWDCFRMGMEWGVMVSRMVSMEAPTASAAACLRAAAGGACEARR